MKSQRGIIATLWLYGIAAVAVLAAIYGAYEYVNHTWETSAGISRGKEIKQAEWFKANADAAEQAEAARRERAQLAAAQSARLATAEGRARDADTKWRRARAEAARARIPLVVADCPGPAGSVPAPAPGGGGLRLAPDLRFSRQFVREYDRAWGGPDGEPIFGNSDRPLETPGAASSVGPDDLLTVHAENASRCSDNARRQNALIDLIERLRAAAPD